MDETTENPAAAKDRDRYAPAELLPSVYEELRRLAASRMARESPGQTLQATALVHEAWLRIQGDANQSWENKAHFFGAASEAMRRILIENARRKSRLKHGGGHVRVDLDDVELSAATPDEKLLLIDEALAELEATQPERARVVVLKFFGGLTNAAAAEAMGISERSLNRHWQCAKTWLLLKMREKE